jgi:outer membrane lipoprotein
MRGIPALIHSMYRYIIVAIAFIMLTSCMSVIRKDLMDTGTRHFSFADLLKNPAAYQGKLFILGGRIVDTKLTRRGSLIEAIYVPVDWTGALKDIEPPARRFLALYPKDRSILDPVIYKRDRAVTIAAVFEGTETGKIDEMDYVFPSFQVVQIYLWEKRLPITCGPYPGPCGGPYPYWGSWYYGGWMYCCP